MDDDGFVDEKNVRRRTSRPTLGQLKAVLKFMEMHPNIAQRKLPHGGSSNQKFRTMWTDLSFAVNSKDGARKTTKGWMKFWSDKRRSIMLKQKQIEQGKLQGKLTPLEQKIMELCEKKPRKARQLKQQSYSDNEEEDDDNDTLADVIFSKDDDKFDNVFSSENDDKQLSMMESLLDVMGQQASAMSLMAQAHLDNSKSLERLAEASHIQALAVDRIANTFENIGTTVHDVRNALLGIDYTMKRCYSTSATQRQNSNIFS